MESQMFIVVRVNPNTRLFSTRNVSREGYDAFLDTQECAYLIRTRKLPPHRLDALRSFLVTHCMWDESQVQKLPARLKLPLRPSAALRFMVFAQFLILFGTPLALIATGVGLACFFDKAKFQSDPGLVLVCALTALTYIAGVITYLLHHRPSRRQAGIRAVVADRLGPFSDPAGWESGLARSVATYLQWNSEPIAWVEDAQQRLEKEEYSDALLLARLSLTLLDRKRDATTIAQAEALTDRCLARLDASKRL
jgi:hypothetical protein